VAFQRGGGSAKEAEAPFFPICIYEPYMYNTSKSTNHDVIENHFEETSNVLSNI